MMTTDYKASRTAFFRSRTEAGLRRGGEGEYQLIFSSRVSLAVLEERVLGRGSVSPNSRSFSNRPSPRSHFWQRMAVSAAFQKFVFEISRNQTRHPACVRGCVCVCVGSGVSLSISLSPADALKIW